MSVQEAILEKVDKIIDNLSNELKERKNIISRYKNVHCVLKKLQIICNSVSVGLGSSAALSFTSGIGAPAGVGLAATTSITAALGILCQIFDERVMRKLHKHIQLQTLARNFDLNLFDKYMKDSNLTTQNWKEILTLLQKFYTDKDMLESKSLFSGPNISQLLKEVQEGSKDNHKVELN